MAETEDGTTVTVTSKGQATIPKEFREKLHIDTPGRVRFVENKDGEVVIRPVKRPSEFRGALAREADTEEKPATELLREERERDKKKADEKFGSLHRMNDGRVQCRGTARVRVRRTRFRDC